MRNNTSLNLIRDKCDKKLKSLATGQEGVVPFYTAMNDLLSDLKIKLEDVGGKDFLQSYGEDAYQKIYALYFYLCKLERNGLIEFVKTASIDSFSILGEKDVDIINYRINQKVTDFWKDHINDNIIISLEYIEFANAGRVSLELREARRQSTFAFVTMLISIITILLTLIFNKYI